MLGKDGLAVSEIGLGCMRMSYGDAPVGDRAEMIGFLRAAVARDITFFDTAEIYGPFTDEDLVGEALEPFRGQVAIATRFGFPIDTIGALGRTTVNPNLSTLNSRLGRIKQVAPEAIKANRGVIDLLARIGEQKRATPALLALACLLARHPWIVPILGSRKLERLDKNLGAAAIELTADDLRDIRAAVPQITVLGNRY